MAEFVLRQNNVEKKVVASRSGDELRFQMDGQTAVLHLLSQGEDGILLARTMPDGSRQQWRLLGYKDGQKRMLWLNGRTHQYERVLPRGSNSASQDVSLSATIPAVVADILVSEGDKVTAGDKLVLLESMKMIIPIQAPYDGTITRLNCATGDSVQAGTRLVELDKSS